MCFVCFSADIRFSNLPVLPFSSRRDVSRSPPDARERVPHSNGVLGDATCALCPLTPTEELSRATAGFGTFVKKKKMSARRGNGHTPIGQRWQFALVFICCQVFFYMLSEFLRFVSLPPPSCVRCLPYHFIAPIFVSLLSVATRSLTLEDASRLSVCNFQRIVSLTLILFKRSERSGFVVRFDCFRRCGVRRGFRSARHLRCMGKGEQPIPHFIRN